MKNLFTKIFPATFLISLKASTFFLVFILSQNVFATSVSDIKEKAGETAEAASDYTKEQKDAFVKEMEGNISALKKKIKDLKSKAGKSKDQTVAKLEKEQHGLEQDLATIKKSSGKAWGRMKDGLSKAWSEIKTSMGDAKDELTK